MEKLTILKIKPLFNRILVTSDKYQDDIIEGGVIVATKGTLKEYQRVVAVGSTVTTIKEGDLVKINPKRYSVFKHQEGSLKDGIVTDNPVIQYQFNIVEIQDTPYLLLYDQDIEYIIEEFNIEEESSLILPEEKHLIL